MNGDRNEEFPGRQNYPFNTRPWPTLIRAFYFFGDSLIVRDYIIHSVICLRDHRRAIGRRWQDGFVY